ncbi:MAG TPA: hypothetical protein VJP76_02870, partial [Candidatus Tumulicola sp.]|nr:hypothetical protein [Candidatus Tumulicola sp.]
MRLGIAAALAAGLLSACSGGGVPATPGAAGDLVRANMAAADGIGTLPRAQAAHARGGVSATTITGSQVIYSGNFNTNTITIFPVKGKNQPPIGHITSGLSNPERLFVGKTLKLYVTNLGNNTITVYDPGATTPSRTISKGIDTPTGVVVGADATVYCANVGNDTVTEYKRGRNTPALTIQLPDSDNPEDLALDAKNNLYVSHPGGTLGGGVLVFAPGKTTGKELGLVIGDPGAIEVDGSGNLIVVDSSAPSVDFFPA